MPVFILIPLLTLSISYFLINLNPLVTKFLVAVGILELMTQTVISYGYFMSCSCSSLPLALGISSPIILPLFLFGGMFLKNGSIPAWLDWIKYISWFFYSYEALVINQWSGVANISCNGVSTNVTQESNLIIDSEFCIKTGSDVFFNEDDFFFDIFMLIVLSVSLRVAAFLALLCKTRRGEKIFGWF